MSATALTATDTLLERNAELSKDLSGKSFTLTPDLHALVLTCADHRVDPAQVLGLELGEAAVLRNPGGRVTPAFISELAGAVAEAAMVEYKRRDTCSREALGKRPSRSRRVPESP